MLCVYSYVYNYNIIIILCIYTYMYLVYNSITMQMYTGAFWETLLQRALKHLKTKKDTQPELKKQEWAIREAVNSESIHES